MPAVFIIKRTFGTWFTARTAGRADRQPAQPQFYLWLVAKHGATFSGDFRELGKTRWVQEVQKKVVLLITGALYHPGGKNVSP